MILLFNYGGCIMDGLEMIYTRRSVRAYTSRQIDDDTIRKIVKAGKLAASGINIQPVEIVAVKDKKIIERIADTTDHGKFIKNAPICFTVFSEDTGYYLEDGCAAAQNILLAARYFGIGTCWVAGDKKHYADKIREICGLRPGYRLICLIPAGYPQNTDSFKEKNIKKEGFKLI
jgi:nitroreductase